MLIGHNGISSVAISSHSAIHTLGLIDVGISSSSTGSRGSGAGENGSGGDGGGDHDTAVAVLFGSDGGGSIEDSVFLSSSSSSLS